MPSELPKIDILSLNQAANVLTSDAKHRYHAMISIGTLSEGNPPGWSQIQGNQIKLRLDFEDFAVPAIFQAHSADGPYSKVSHPHWCQPEQLEQLFEFAPQVNGDLLIHCFAGVSRSSAIALSFIASRLGPGREKEAVEHLYERKQTIYPNAWVVALADCVLGREGRLFQALAKRKQGRDKPWTAYPEVMQTMDYARAHWKLYKGGTAF